MLESSIALSQFYRSLLTTGTLGGSKTRETWTCNLHPASIQRFCRAGEAGRGQWDNSAQWALGTLPQTAAGQQRRLAQTAAVQAAFAVRQCERQRHRRRRNKCSSCSRLELITPFMIMAGVARCRLVSPVGRGLHVHQASPCFTRLHRLPAAAQLQGSQRWTLDKTTRPQIANSLVP